MKALPTTLADWTQAFLFSHPGYSVKYREQFQGCAANLDRWSGQPVLLSELSASLLLEYMRHLERNRKAPATINNHRKILLALWRSASDAGVSAPPPKATLIPKYPEYRDIPEAWTVAQVEALLGACTRTQGNVAGIPAGSFWESLVLTTYWTGARIGALRQARSMDFDGQRFLTLRAATQKNRRTQIFALHPQAVESIKRIWAPERELLWPWPWYPSVLFRQFRRIVEAAGIPSARGHRNLFQKIRRSSLSYCYAADPAIAQYQAGHSSLAITLRHYIDPRIIPRKTAMDVLPIPQF